MGKGSNTTTTQSGPPAQYLQAYQNINNQAQNVASTPYQPYTGNLVAGLSPDQQSAISSIQGLQGAANPYIDAAAQQIGASTNPLTPAIQPYAVQATSNFENAANMNLAGIVSPGITTAQDIYGQSDTTLTPQQFSGKAVAQYESPYTQQVVNATEQQFNNQNAQQQQGVEGNAIAQGAFGGDRSAVAQGITAGQEQLAQAPVIAGLENQGYNQALNEFNTQQQTNLGAQQASLQLQQGAAAGILAGSAQNLAAYQQEAQNQLAAGQGITGVGNQVLGANQAQDYLASQAGFGLGNLGNEALNTGLASAQAQLGVGGLEQQQAQQELNVPYEQYTAAQAYPFQTTGWLANIAEGLGGASGGTGSTTTPGPSAGSQIAGTALLGTGILGQTGAFGSNGWLTGGSSAGSGYVGGANPYGSTGSFFGLGDGSARGGAIPHRAGGGGLSDFGLPSSPTNNAIQIPTGVPNISASIVPGADGMGAKSSGKGSFNLNTSTGSTTTTSGGGDPILGLAGGIAGGIFGGPAGSILGSQIGSRLAFGGGVNTFKPPHIGLGMHGITGSFSPHLPKFAAGGAPSIAAGNGIMIPQLGGGAGGISAGGPGLASVNSYLAANAAPAPAPATTPAPAAAAPAAATPAPAAASPTTPFAPASGPAPAPGSITPLPGLNQPEEDYLQQFLSNEVSQGNNQAMLNGSPGGARGGSIMGIQHRDDGGGIESDPLPKSIRDHLLNDAYVPPDNSGYYGPPQGRTSTGPGPNPQIGTALTDATSRPYTGPPTPPQAAQQAQQSAAPSGGGGSSSGSPWATLLNIGAGILSGTSPHAGVNIGRGTLEGLQLSEQQRAREEQQNLARLQQQDTAEYRRGELSARQQEVQQQGQTAQARLAQEAANQQLLRQHQQDELAQQWKIAQGHLGIEGANAAEAKRYHDIESIPPEVREAQWFSQQSPEKQAQYIKAQNARKGIPDITIPGGGDGTPTAVAPSGARAPIPANVWDN